MPLRTYQIADKNDSRKLAQFLAHDGQGLLPMVELLCHAEMAVDELIDVAGRAAIEAVLTLSAQQTAGPKPGKAGGEITWYGRQKTTIPLAERKLRVEKPRLRRKGKGPDKEVR
jgi:putative transposase